MPRNICKITRNKLFFLLIVFSFILNLYFISHIFSNFRPPSFLYRLPITNDTSYHYLYVTTIQLTDIMQKGERLKGDEKIVSKDQNVTFKIKGDFDSPDTLFLIKMRGQ